MTIPARELAGVPGFGSCFTGRCRYVDSGSAAICSACASSRMEALAPADRRCEVCDRPFAVGESACQNRICSMATRHFDWNYSIAIKSGALERAILNYKFGRERRWSVIFARVLLGFLDDHARLFREFDLILSSPAYADPAVRAFDHMREVLRAAERQAPGLWPFDLREPPAIIRTAALDKMTKRPYHERRAIAVQLRAALSVPDVGRTAGQRIVVVDDVFTSGSTLEEVARALREQGQANGVVGLSLARQPWRTPPVASASLA